MDFTYEDVYELLDYESEGIFDSLNSFGQIRILNMINFHLEYDGYTFDDIKTIDLFIGDDGKVGVKTTFVTE